MGNPEATPSSLEDIVPTNAIRIPGPGRPSPKLVQQYLDTGVPLSITCKDCGFFYCLASPEERHEHHLHHDDYLHGPIYHKIGITARSKVPKLWSDIDEEGKETFVIAIDRTMGSAVRDYAANALKRADSILGAEEDDDDTLWSGVAWDVANRTFASNKLGTGIDAKTLEELPSKHLIRFKIYLYINGKGRVLGCLLAEHILKGREVHRVQVNSDEFGEVPSCVVREEVVAAPRNTDTKRFTHDAFIGVNKIWVHEDQRFSGIARRLIDIARETFYGGIVRTITKNEIAWTELTGMGSKLAESYMKHSKFEDLMDTQGFLWLTYDDGDVVNHDELQF